jgi:SNF2 family DNA or RNA helicase
MVGSYTSSRSRRQYESTILEAQTSAVAFGSSGESSVISPERNCLVITPYKHQLQAVEKLARKELPGRLIADEMGLGKTLEGLLIDAELRSRKHWERLPPKEQPPYMRPTLIVAPLATHYDAWVPAIRSLPELSHWDEKAFRKNIVVIDPKKRHLLVERLKPPYPMYVIVHYEALRLIPELKEITWFDIICDEVHRVKNRKAQAAVNLKKLKTYFKTGLSGTPGDDKPADIWSVLNWLYPKEFASYWKFVNTYCIQETSEGKYGNTFRKITGVNEAAVPTLHKEWDAWFLRRTKDEVGIDLPEKYYTPLHVDLLPAQRRAYDQMRKDMIAWIGEHEDTPLTAPVVVSQLVRLQQMALATVDFEVVNDKGDTKVVLRSPSSKLNRLMELIEDNANEPFVIFSQSRGMVNLVLDRASKAGILCAGYHGNVSLTDRDANVQAFQAGDIQLLAATIAAGREGITLHRSRTVVFLDRMWNPTKNLQAEDRLHRIGQKNAVQVIDIVANDTVDMGRNQRIQTKLANLKILLGDK